MNRIALTNHSGRRRIACRAFALFVGLLGASIAASAQTAEDLKMTVGKSIVIDYPSDVRQISTSNPDIIDASPITTREILVHGKGLGSATMVIWSRGGERTFYNVNVEMNLDPLRRLLRESFPNEMIQPDSSRDSLSLNGTVSTKEVGDRVVALASGFAKTVVNNLQVVTPPVDKQILLRVKFAELDRAREAQYGVNLIGTAGNSIFGTGTSGTNVTKSADGRVTYSIPQALTAFAFDPSLDLGAFVKALQTESVLQILAEPNLITTNGKEAYFLVGGELPIPVLQGGANSGAVTIQYREFGIRLRFTPLITGNNTIKMHLNQEVSSIDNSNGTTVSGFFIPAFSTRRAETDVELSEGQSFVIAGLLDNREQDSFSKLPVLGDIPILGPLFKAKTEKRNQTDLIVIVTPEITQPLNPNDPKPEISFPRDFLVRMTPEDVKAEKAGGKKN